MRMPIIGVAPPTVLLSCSSRSGMLLERPAAGVMSVVTSRGPGGVVVRRLAYQRWCSRRTRYRRHANRHGLRCGEPSFQVAVLAAVTSVAALVLPVLVAVPLNRAHVALEESHARTRELIELAPDGIFLLDLEGRYTDVNGAGCRMLGYARDEIIGKTIIESVPPEEVERVWQAREALLEGETHVAEWHARRKDGSYLPVEVSARILAGGRWQGFVRDISERTRVREQLREAQERLELALEGADLATWDWNVVSGQVVFNGTLGRDARFLSRRGPRPRRYMDRGRPPGGLAGGREAAGRMPPGRVPGYEAECASGPNPASGSGSTIAERCSPATNGRAHPHGGDRGRRHRPQERPRRRFASRRRSLPGSSRCPRTPSSRSTRIDGSRCSTERPNRCSGIRRRRRSASRSTR